MKLSRRHGLALASLLTIACSDPLPVAPIAPTPAPPTPAPTAAPTPAPTPTPGPEICDECEPIVTNRASPVRLTLRLYTIEDGFGKFVRNPDPLAVVPLGWFARLDVVAKDAEGKETNGNEDIVWHYSDCCLARESGNHTHQRRLKALAPGYLEVWVTQEGIRSNTIGLTFGN